MDLQMKKLAFLEAFMKISDLSVIDKLTQTLQQESKSKVRPSIESFAGILDNQDAKTFLEASESSRKIDSNEW